MGSRLRIALFVVLLISVAFVCGQQTATPSRPTGGTTTTSDQVIDLQAEPGREGTFSTPGYPDNYPNNTKITWRINGTSTDGVYVQFIHFDLERPNYSGNCPWDSVAVYDDSNNLMGRRLCGNELPDHDRHYISRVLTLVFISDANEERSGFFARYSPLQEGVKPSQVVPQAISPPPEFYTYCKELDFEAITIPNYYEHSSVEEILNSTQWQEMKNANISCHPQIQLFLCSLLMPRFTRNISNYTLPCLSWCWEVQHSCSSEAINNGSVLNDKCWDFPDTECVNLEPPEDCYYGNGWNYKGKATLPVESGQTCLNWTDVLWPSTLKHTQWADPRENYCRNMFNEGLEPACYNKDGIPEPCGVKPCDKPACSLLDVELRLGRLSPSRNFYKVGEKVFIDCDTGYFMEKDERWITCTGNGRWNKDWLLECPADYALKLSNTLLDSERYSPQLAPSMEHVEVFFEAAVVEIIDADDKNENMLASIAFRLQWKDDRLSWNPTDYGNRGRVVVSSKKVWTPKIYLQRNGDPRFSDFPDARVNVTSDGWVKWEIIDLLITACDLESALFPFDSMKCPVCLGANTDVERFSCATNTSVNEQKSPIENFMLCGDVNGSEVDQWNAQWTISVSEGEFGKGCINVQFDRLPTFHFCTTLSPPIILSLLMCITFLLPAEKGDRLSFGMTILLSMVVSLVFITDVLPAKGSMPVAAVLVIVYMCLMGLFIIATVINIRIRSMSRDLHPLVKKVFLVYFARLLMLGDLTETEEGHTPLNAEEDDFEMVTGMTRNDSKPAEAEPRNLLDVDVLMSLKESMMSLKESVNGLSTAVEAMSTEPSGVGKGKPDCKKLCRVLDRICFILYVSGLIIAIPIVIFSNI